MKTNLDSIFKTDEDLEKDGVWFTVSDKTGFLVKPFRPSNPQVKAAMAAHYKPYARQIEMGTLDDKKAQEIQVKIFVGSCLVEWRGVEIDGKDTPYSKDVAIPFFMGLPELFNALWAYCGDFKNYREDVGNS